MYDPISTDDKSNATGGGQAPPTGCAFNTNGTALGVSVGFVGNFNPLGGTNGVF